MPSRKEPTAVIANAQTETVRDDTISQSLQSDVAVYSIFVCTWTAAALFHNIKRADIVGSPEAAAFTAAAFFALMKPRSLHRFMVVALCHITLFVSRTPNAGNHEAFAFLCEVCFVCVYARLAIRRDDRLQAAEWMNVVAPAMRWATVILYFFTVFHKLNTSYFSTTSCGAVLPVTFLTDNPLTAMLGLPALPESVRHGAAWFFVFASVAMEIAIPVFLAARRTAYWGFFAGFAFHFFLGIFYFWHFTPMLYALFLLFLPARFHEWLVYRFRHVNHCVIRKYPAFTPGRLLRTALLAAILSLPVLCLAAQEFEWLRLQVGLHNRGGRSPNTVPVITILCGWLPFVIYSVALAGAVGWFIRARNADAAEGGGDENRFRLRTAVAWLPIILVLNGFCPYLGIKTHQSFAMFSNLCTEYGETNHFFMPLIELTDWQRDVIWPIHEQKYSDNERSGLSLGKGYVYAAYRDAIFRRIQNGEANIHVSYIRNGRRHHIRDAESHIEFATPRPWIMRKFIVFRRIPLPAERDLCTY